ncbi:hypothetical protein [Shimia sp.]|uniref:hypothetical protein n=1 Tax=unclassified Shimia TaxID=2630038 RepID=UPI0025E9248D|nr:hypothetical protein [Shimia sp.]
MRALSDCRNTALKEVLLSVHSVATSTWKCDAYRDSHEESVSRSLSDVSTYGSN